MNLKIFNLCVLAGWVLITLGAVCIHWAAGIVVSGVVLIALTLLMAAKFGVMQAPPEQKTEDGAQ